MKCNGLSFKFFKKGEFVRKILLNLTVILTLMAYWSPAVQADDTTSKDLGFRFQWDNNTNSGRCLNNENKEGYNPHFVGICGDLRGLKLNNEDLNGLDLSGANFDGVSLKGAKLNGANLRGVRATGTDFSKADLNGANFDGAIVSGSLFNRSRMNGARFLGANLSGSKIKESQLHGIQMQNANLGGADIDSALKTANLLNATYTVGTVLPFEMAEAQKRGMKTIQAETSVVKNPTKDSDTIKKEERQPAGR
jgi:uncharacterized protein YjbI with pentapeptide repeats